MTYLKSENTPEIHENLPKRLDWMEDGIVNAGSAKSNNDIVYVAAPTGVAATDNAAIAAAITACPTGGTVQLQAGTYALIDGTTTTSLAIAKKLTLRGQGGADTNWTTHGTLLTVDHATAVGISISAHGVHIENLAIQNIHATAPTAGASIQTVTGGGNSTHYGPDLSVRGFYINIDHQAGAEWFMDPSCFMYDWVFAGLSIQNIDLVDGGDMAVSGMFVAGPVNNGHYGILWKSGGGFKGYSIKINNGRPGSSSTLLIGIGIELQDGVATSDFLLMDSSIENCSWGILLEHAGPSNTGTFGNIVIAGCQTLTVGGAGTASIAIAPNGTSKVSQVFVGGNVIRSTVSAQQGLLFRDLDNALHGPNVYKINTGFNDGGGNTNLGDFDSAPLKSPLTTKGDLWGFGTGNARLAVGLDTQLLAADSTQTLGVKWAYATIDGGSA